MESRKRRLVFVLFALCAFAAYYFATQDPLPKRSGSLVDADKGAVRVVCQQAIKNSLKAPASAELPHISLSDIGVAAEDPAVMRLITYVDAENSFGSTVRTRFQCDCKKYNGAWKVVNLGAVD